MLTVILPSIQKMPAGTDEQYCTIMVLLFQILFRIALSGPQFLQHMILSDDEQSTLTPCQVYLAVFTSDQNMIL